MNKISKAVICNLCKVTVKVQPEAKQGIMGMLGGGKLESDQRISLQNGKEIKRLDLCSSCYEAVSEGVRALQK